MDKARITVRLRDGRVTVDRPAGDRPYAAPAPDFPASARSGTLGIHPSRESEVPGRNDPAPVRSSTRWPAVFTGSDGLLHRRARRLGRHWVVPVAVALAVGSLLGWICLAVFARAGEPHPTVDPTSNIHLYVVQAGAFSDLTRAQTFASTLQKQGLAAKLAGGRPTLVLVGVATDPKIPGPLGDALRRLQIATAVKPYRPMAPPSRIEGIADGQGVAAALRKSIDVLGEAVDRWSQGHSPVSPGLDPGIREIDHMLSRGVSELNAAGRSAQADLLQRWRNDWTEAILRIERDNAPGPVMDETLQAMDDYEQLIGNLHGSRIAGPP
ncbi:MAG: SPOR domain-containing protein [Kyrpidia sp.]|nr:SPOR domain-containing protein [Kyrpidia sp.]